MSRHKVPTGFLETENKYRSSAGFGLHAFVSDKEDSCYCVPTGAGAFNPGDEFTGSQNYFRAAGTNSSSADSHFIRVVNLRPDQ